VEELLQQILAKLEDLSQGQQAQNQRLQRLEEGQEGLRTDVGSLRQGQKTLHADVSSFQEGQEALRTDVGSLRQGQESLQNRLVALEVRLENEVFEKIRALFDARQVHLDYFESIRDALTRVEENIDHLIRRERQQDIRLDEHDREIRLLRLRK
jgi:FtsZ-binding cell division protein ZapB